MRRLGAVWMAVLAGVVLSGCARESGSSDGPSPTSRPVGVSRGLHQRKAAVGDGSAAPARFSVGEGDEGRAGGPEVGADLAVSARRTPAGDFDDGGAAPDSSPAAEEPMDRPSTATTAPAEDRPAGETARRDRRRA